MNPPMMMKRSAIAAMFLMLACAIPMRGQMASNDLPDAPLPQTRQPQTTPPASSSQGTQPSLGDLGLTQSQIQGNAAAQARLDKRTHMLKVHQRLGLLTTIPLAATLFSGGVAPCGKNCTGNHVGEDFHASLGTLTLGMYAATAYYAIAAPRIDGTEKRGAIRWHEALVWVHGPGMIMTAVLGEMAFKQENAGEKVHGIASAHGAVGATTAIAYGASIVAVSWPIKVKFWEHQ
jgi:hypothetical protein